MKNRTQVDYVIVGAGVVGGAVAARLCEKYPEKVVILLEAGPRPAEGVTSRNSGVIHAGIYYPPRSFKAETCVRGKLLLYEWVLKHNVPHRRCGKFIVATTKSAISNLEALYSNGKESGVDDLKLVGPSDVIHREPYLKCEAAIWSPSTGIVDPAQLTRSFLSYAIQNGLVFMPNHSVVRIFALSPHNFEIVAGEEEIKTPVIINCAGLYADRVAKMAGVDKYKIFPCRGDYFSMKTKMSFNSLIYPVKDPDSPGLGVHLTIDLAGKYRLGPDTEYVESRDSFLPREDKIGIFKAAAKKLLGEEIEFELTYDTCGIRPKLRAPTESVEKDFVISEDLPGLINTVGIESPGLTASLAIAERIVFGV